MRRISLIFLLALSPQVQAEPPRVLPNTQELRLTGEIDRKLIQGVSLFLDRQLAASSLTRNAYWRATTEPWSTRLASRRGQLQKILGMREARFPKPQLESISTIGAPSILASSAQFDVWPVRWRAYDDVYGEGLLLQPKQEIAAQIVLIPDADQTPEQLIGITETTKNNGDEYQLATLLAAHRCQVLVPTIISRTRGQFSWHGRRVDITNREFLYRPAFELGRHLIGYEVQKILAGVSALQASREGIKLPVGIVGWGEGGELALFTGAIDPRIRTACISGYFGPREQVWQQPIDRNVFGQLKYFGDAELAAMFADRQLIVEASESPQVELAGGPGAPGKLTTPSLHEVHKEFDRGVKIAKAVGRSTDDWAMIASDNGNGPHYCQETIQAFLRRLTGKQLSPEAFRPYKLDESLHKKFDANQRLHRQMRQLDRHTQQLLVESPYVRSKYMGQLGVKGLDDHRQTVAAYRRKFSEDVMGRFDLDLLGPNPRSRLYQVTEKWVCYEVVLDVFPDVIAYGLLLMPRDLEPNEERPVVVCQHGLEGKPQDVIGDASFHYYKAFAARLAERGFITFAPQNLYRHRDAFRVLQRKANPLGKTLFSIITPQHQQIVNWLKALPNVDEDRIAFYGLSYGGKTAMRVPALVTDYCLSICSADFNDWVWKNASTRSPYSYVWTGEYEIFEWNLGSTFNYAEMAALIAPRPFMVERGHFDGVAPDERVAMEFAKVRHLYQAKLGIGDRCEIEFFVGPHTINGKGTFDFLHRHLRWPNPDKIANQIKNPD